jgi:hypothetical protein
MGPLTNRRITTAFMTLITITVIALNLFLIFLIIKG